MYNITSESLKKYMSEYAKNAKTTGKDKPIIKSGINQKKKDGIVEAQKLLITWLIEEEGLYEQIKEYISPEDFTTDLYKKVASLVFAQLEGDARVNPVSVMNQFMDEEEQREIAGLFNAKLAAVDSDEGKIKAIKDVLYKVKKNSFDTKKGSSTDPKELMLLIEEKKKLDRYKNIPIRLR